MVLSYLMIALAIAGFLAVRLLFRERVIGRPAGNARSLRRDADDAVPSSTPTARRRGPAIAAASRQFMLKFIFNAAISIIVLGIAAYIILSRQFEKDAEKWAFGAIGIIVGNAISYVSK